MTIQTNRKTLIAIGAIFTGAFLLVATILWLHRPQHFGKIEVSPFENDMMESLVRGVIREQEVQGAPVCFLSFGEGQTSPSPGFIGRFADCHQPAVCSMGSSVSPPVNRYFEKDNGRPGTVIQIFSFHEFVSGVFDITVSISSLPRGHDRVMYRLSETAGNWAIKKRTPL